MPRAERMALGGYVYHVLNRANGRLRIFRKESDFLAFEKILGHLYQGRYKSFPVQSDPYYLNVLRYIEANPVRAGLVRDPRQWAWSSLAVRQGRESAVTLSAGPVALPPKWAGLVRAVLSPADVDGISNSIRRGAPFGAASWVAATATSLRLLSTLRPRGRPRKST